jgi:hypothetical protein
VTSRSSFAVVLAVLSMTVFVACQKGTSDPVQSTRPGLPTTSASARADPSSSPDIWQSYTNTRYGYTVYYPKGWTAGEEATNRDGLVLVGDHQASLTAYGTSNSVTVEQVHKDGIESAKSLGVAVTYETSKSNLSVVSGTTDDRVYYSSAWCGKGSCNYLVFWYQRSDKATMDPLVTTIAQRFIPGRLDVWN